jgi:hypothetical protein
MAGNDSSGRTPPRNLRFFRAALIAVRPSRTSGTIALEVVDSNGDGFCAELSLALALDAALQLIGAYARAHGYAAPGD